MKIIKTYENYNLEELDLGRFSQIIDKNHLIPNSDGTFDYNGGLDFSWMKLNSLLEIPIQFRNVKGVYYCSDNNLISLEGSPEYVGLNFTCFRNKLISLQYAPKKMKKDFWCDKNFLLSKFYLSKIDGDFWSSGNPFEITDNVIETVKRMTHEQQISELQFFQLYDNNAYSMMLEILDDLGVDVDYRKEIHNNMKDKENLKVFGWN